MVLDGDTGTLTRVSVDGTLLPAAKQLSAKVAIDKEKVAPDPELKLKEGAWQSAWAPLHTEDLELWTFRADFEGKGEEPIRFELYRSGDTIAGGFVAEGSFLEDAGIPDEDIKLETLYGPVRGTRAKPHLDSKSIANAPLPCLAGCEATFRCGGQGPGTCNSSAMCTADCLELE